MKITAINKLTGEVVDLLADTLPDIAAAWRVAQEYEKVAKSLKDQLKKIVPSVVDNDGHSDQVGSYMFKVNTIQRMTYDKAVMRQVLDPDLFDIMLKPDKQAMDKWLKDNVETSGEVGTELRKNMLPDGTAYQVIKLEKVSND